MKKKRPGRPTKISTVSRQVFWILAVAFTALALLLRVYRIGAHELWLDEAFSNYVSTLPDWFASIRIDNNPPLYYLLLRGWVRLAGTTEAALRLPSALAGTALVGLVIWAGTEIFDRQTGLLAGLIASLAPIQLYYSQEARVYTLLDAVLLLCWILIWRAAAADSWRRWALVSAAATLALYSHYLALLAVLPASALLLASSRPRIQLKRFALALGVSVALFAPWVIDSFVFVPRPAVGTSWIENVWSETPKLFAIPLSLEIFALGSQTGLIPMWMHHFSSIAFPVALRMLGIAALIGLALFLCLRRGDDVLPIPKLESRKFGVTVLLFAPLAALWLISWIKPIYAIGRYDVLAYPAFALLVGLALRKAQMCLGVPIALVAVAALLVPALVKIAMYFDVSGASGGHQLAQLLDADARNEDVVVFTGLRALPVLYYMGQLGYSWKDGFCVNPARARRFYCRMYPRTAEQTPAATSPERLLGSEESARMELADYLGHFDPRHGTFWIILGGEVVGGKRLVPKADQLLIQALVRSGFKRIPNSADRQLLVDRFQYAGASASHP